MRSRCWRTATTGEIASLAGAADDPSYFQISLLLSFLESVPDVAGKIKEPLTTERKFEEVVKSAQEAAVLVLVC